VESSEGHIARHEKVKQRFLCPLFFPSLKPLCGSDGIEPDLVTYDSLLAVGVKSTGVAAEAIEIFEEMKRVSSIALKSSSYDCLVRYTVSVFFFLSTN